MWCNMNINLIVFDDKKTDDVESLTYTLGSISFNAELIRQRGLGLDTIPCRRFSDFHCILLSHADPKNYTN